MTPEAKVKKIGRATMTRMGMYHFPAFSGGYGRSGVPDDIGCHQGCFVAVEYKAKGGKPTALQLKTWTTYARVAALRCLLMRRTSIS